MQNTNPTEHTTPPRWLVFAPFLGKPPPLTARAWSVIGLVAVATLFDQYDLALFSLALKQIQAELAMPEEQLGMLGAIVRLSALPAIGLAVAADRWGRRRLLLVTIVAYTLFTGATAFAPNTESFLVCQFLARTFGLAEVLLAYVVISEELPSEHRGWGIGALAALAACGNGLALLLFGLIDYLPLGWRSLYLVGLFPLVLVAWFRRRMPETHRFESLASTSPPGGSLRDALGPLVSLLRTYPGRLLAVAGVVLSVQFVDNPAGFFGAKYVQEVHGWQPWHYSLLGFFGGFVGIMGGAFAGRLSDRRGRRAVAIAFLTVHPLLVMGFYSVESSWSLGPLWVAQVFSGFAGGVVIGAYGNELFPTSQRSSAAGARYGFAAIGAILGLSAESLLYAITQSHAQAVVWLAGVGILAPLIVLLSFPETSGKELEEISPEQPESAKPNPPN